MKVSFWAWGWEFFLGMKVSFWEWEWVKTIVGHLIQTCWAFPKMKITMTTNLD